MNRFHTKSVDCGTIKMSHMAKNESKTLGLPVAIYEDKVEEKIKKRPNTPDSIGF